MSLENLKEYARRCATDPELFAAVKTIGLTDIDEHMRHAGSMGLDWTRDDLVAFRKEVTDDDTEDLVDLTEEELERVAGGAVAASLVAAVVVGAAVGGGLGAAAVGGAVGGATAAGKGGW